MNCLYEGQCTNFDHGGSGCQRGSRTGDCSLFSRSREMVWCRNTRCPCYQEWGSLPICAVPENIETGVCVGPVKEEQA